MIGDEASSSSFSSVDSSSSSSSVKRVISKTKSNKWKAMLLVIDVCHFQLKNFNSKKRLNFGDVPIVVRGVLMHTTLGDEFVRYSGKAIAHSHLPNPAESEIRNL